MVWVVTTDARMMCAGDLTLLAALRLSLTLIHYDGHSHTRTRDPTTVPPQSSD